MRTLPNLKNTTFPIVIAGPCQKCLKTKNIDNQETYDPIFDKRKIKQYHILEKNVNSLWPKPPPYT